MKRRLGLAGAAALTLALGAPTAPPALADQHTLNDRIFDTILEHHAQQRFDHAKAEQERTASAAEKARRDREEYARNPTGNDRFRRLQNDANEQAVRQAEAAAQQADRDLRDAKETSRVVGATANPAWLRQLRQGSQSAPRS